VSDAEASPFSGVRGGYGCLLLDSSPLRVGGWTLGLAELTWSERGARAGRTGRGFGLTARVLARGACASGAAGAAGAGAARTRRPG
jgi:hypothetical protein